MMKCFSLLSLVFITSPLLALVPYRVEYLGLDDAASLKAVRSVATLNTLQKNPPDSLCALRYRAESDIPEILKVLHAHGYYDATVEMSVTKGVKEAVVKVSIYPGPAYRIGSFNLMLFRGKQDRCVECSDLHKEALGLEEGKVILAASVIQAELKALQSLADCGYPLATVSERFVIADGDTKQVSLRFAIDTGSLCYFGPTTIEGCSSVKCRFFEERMQWKEGEVYKASAVEETQKILMESGLFSSVLITHGEQPKEGDILPLRIEVAESKHKSIYGGVSYQTYYGPGLTFGWENRNVSGLGRKLSLQGDITKRSHSGLATYHVPNFLRVGQDLVWEAGAIHQHILPYLERSYHLTSRLERSVTKHLRMALGLEGERLFINASVQDGEYWITELPIFVGLNLANDLLNPTKGFNVEYTATPTLILSPDRRFFLSQVCGFSYFYPLDHSHRVTIAQRLSGGLIWSGSEGTVPVSKRFFGGSEEDLRGYAYYSVSPLSRGGRPEGGRSALYYTLETRLRLSKTLGFVPFFDLGHVTNQDFFSPKGEWLKSVGFGVRYFSFVGPFRLDVGFPLNPREGLDKKYKFLLSIGQAF